MGYSMNKGSGIVALVIALAIGWAVVGPRDAAAAWSNETIGNYQYYYWNGNQKFRYDNNIGQWWHYSTIGFEWYTLSTIGRPSTFIGDGGTYILGNGLNYRYLANSDFGFFNRNGAYRFYYRYGSGQWFTSGFGGGWYVLGATSLSAAVLGDGATHSLGNGLNYRYLANNDFGFFSRGGAYRFYYRYNTGQWYTSGFGGGWYVLGIAGLSAAVLGDGNSRSLGNDMTYRYVVANDFGFFSRGSAYRFYYRYNTGQWYTSGFGGGWYVLGIAGLSAAVLGDGNSRSLGNDMTYRYVVANDFGFFSRGSAYRFYYRYNTGQWYTSGVGGGWYVLGTPGLTAAVMEDGAPHALGNGLAFRYLASEDYGFFSKGPDDRLQYRYGIGQWLHSGYAGNWYVLAFGGLTALFIGDGMYHELGNGFWYQYLVSGDAANWSADGADSGIRFQYSYSGGLWWHREHTGSYLRLSNLQLSADFIGDSAYHTLSNGFWYQYVSGVGYWSRDGTAGGDRFSYMYNSGQWKHRGITGGFYDLGPVDMSSGFMTDAAYHNFGSGFWYQYLISGDASHWSRDGTSSGTRFRYEYGTGLWRHRGYGGTYWDLGSGLSSEFIGDGYYHNVGAGWHYGYVNGSTDYGYWSRTGMNADLRFRYNYTYGQWEHKGAYGSLNLLGHIGMHGSFIGRGGDLSNGYTFTYDYAGDLAVWYQKSDARYRYSYDYAGGAWLHFDPAACVGGCLVAGGGAGTDAFNPGEP